MMRIHHNHLLLLALPIALFAPTADSFSISYQRLDNVVANKHSTVMRLNPTSFKGTDFVITEYPRPALRRVPNKPITEFDDAFQTKTKEMLMVMYESKGVGLAAPQIGLNENVFVYNPSDSKSMERIVCNPEITKYSDEIIVEQEGCLSLRSDECAGQVARSKWIDIEYQNELGQKVRRRLKDFEARVFQHEVSIIFVALSGLILISYSSCYSKCF
jgi:peptide deformylase